MSRNKRSRLEAKLYEEAEELLNPAKYLKQMVYDAAVDYVAPDHENHGFLSYVGALSGAALGFITADVPGAVVGAQLGWRKGSYDSVASSPNNSNMDIDNPDPLNEGINPSPVASTSSLARALVSQGRGLSARTPAVSHGKRYVAMKKKRLPKISRRFKLAVKAANGATDIHGSFSQISYGQLYDPNGNGSQRSTFRMQGQADHTVWSFDPEDWLHMVSVLWNQKPDSQTSRDWADNNNIGGPDDQNPQMTFNKIDATPTPANVQGLDGNNAEFVVKNSFETRFFKNNSCRTQTIHMYIVAPKDISMKASTSRNQNGGTEVGVEYVDDPVTFWQTCLIQDAKAGKNVSQSGSDTYGMTPLANAAFRKYFKIEHITIVLEPGQTYKHYLQGPSDFNVKFDKFFKNTVYLGLQKFMRGVFYTIIPGLVNSAGGNVGRYISDDTLGVACELTRYASFKMPEQTALRFKLNNVTAGALYNLKNNQRRNCYFHTAYVLAPGGAKYRVDAQNPAAPQNL